MPAEVYSGTREAVPRRNILVALLLLVGTSLLAGVMVRQRSGVRLAEPVRLKGWTASVAAPAGFALRSTAYYERWQMALFLGPIPPNELIHLMVWERPVERGVHNDVLAEAVLRMTGSLLGREVVKARTMAGEPEPMMGDVPAAEVWSPSLSIAARAGVRNGIAYGVSISGQGAPLSADAYERFDACCRSIEPAVSPVNRGP